MRRFQFLIYIKRFYSKKHSSQLWLQRQMKDPYVKKAREEDWRCRSAYKLLEMDEKHKLLKPGQVVVDCGCAPGSWTQVIVQRINADGKDPKVPTGIAVGIDIQHVVPIDGAILFHQCDFTTPETQAKVLNKLEGRKVDLVLSDMSPAASGIKTLDHHIIVELASSVIRFSTIVLKEGGHVLCKIWMGEKQQLLENGMRKLFKDVKAIKPKSSRSDSAELYLLGKSFEGLTDR